MPEITVAITTHNLEAYLTDCLEELLAQTYQDFQILVYDDCSGDGTREILAAYGQRLGDKLRVILGQTPMGSPARSRNAILGSGQITGRYAVFLDGDDRLEPDFLEALHTAAVSGGADIALCAYDRFESETGHVLCREMGGFPSEIPLPAKDDTLAFINSALWNKLIRTELLAGLRIPDFQVGEDLCFHWYLYQRSRKLACVDRVLIHYRVRAGSVISNTREQTMYDLARELERIWKGTEEAWVRDTVALVAFIHVGISMASRAYDNHLVDHRAFIRWVSKEYFPVFHWFAGNRWFTLVSLGRHGVKGLGLWCGKVCYRLGIFHRFLWAYRTVTRLLRMDIKF